VGGAPGADEQRWRGLASVALRRPSLVAIETHSLSTVLNYAY